MKIFTVTNLLRTLLLVTALAVWAVCWLGCGGDDNPGNTGGSNTGGNNTGGSGGGGSYDYVTIGGKKWMKKNLNVETADSWCYDNDPANCEKYGRLYTWQTALTACPAGWHLPTRQEWGELAIAAGGYGTYGAGGTAGRALKSTNGWNNSGNGTDAYGFSALPGGFRYSGGSFGNVGYGGYWWAATENSSGVAYNRNMFYADDYAVERIDSKSYAYSVRCVKN